MNCAQARKEAFMEKESVLRETGPQLWILEEEIDSSNVHYPQFQEWSSFNLSWVLYFRSLNRDEKLRM